MYRTTFNTLSKRYVATQSTAKRVWSPKPRQSTTPSPPATAQAHAATGSTQLHKLPTQQSIPHQTLATAEPSQLDEALEPEFDAVQLDTAAAIPEITRNSGTLASNSSSTFPQSAFPSNTSFTSSPVIANGQSHGGNDAHSTPPVEIDWATSYHGLSAQPFSQRQADILMRPLEPAEIEIKPDGLLYLPEILYRRILNQAFGPGGWGMVPRGEMTVMKSMVTREWGLVAGGRLVSVARGEQTYFDPSGLPTATEGCKSNALMRCCKDLGIASELWDPAFIRQFKAQHCVEAWTEHGSTKKKQKRWRKKGNKFEYPLKEAAV